MSARRKVVGAGMLAVGAVFSWGGILYGISNPNEVKAIGVIVMLIGYGVFLLGAVILYDEPIE